MGPVFLRQPFRRLFRNVAFGPLHRGELRQHGGVDAYFLNGSPSPNGVPSRALQCPGGGANPSGLPATIGGNVLLGPCSGSNGISATYADPSGQYRGFIFWQDRSATGAAQWQGGGASLVSGFMYFHQCNSDGSGTEPCPAPPAAFNRTFNLVETRARLRMRSAAL